MSSVPLRFKQTYTRQNRNKTAARSLAHSVPAAALPANVPVIRRPTACSQHQTLINHVTSPQKHVMSPDQHVMNPQKLLLSPQKDVMIPQKHVMNPQKHVHSPDQHVMNPQKLLLSPQKHVMSPQKHAMSPQNMPHHKPPPNFSRAHKHRVSTAKVLTSYVAMVTTNKTPAYRSVSTQCNIDSKVIPVIQLPQSKQKDRTPPKQSDHTAPSDQIVCNLEHKTEDLMIVKYCVNGHVFSGVLVRNGRPSSDLSVPDFGLFAEQLPSQYHKKLKSKLGILFENNCDSENSDCESLKTKLTKLKNSEIRAMKASIAGPSTAHKPSDLTKHVFDGTVVPSARPNTPHENVSNHNKKSIAGMSNFLKEAARLGAHKADQTFSSSIYPCSKKTKTEPDVLANCPESLPKITKTKQTTPTNSNHPSPKTKQIKKETKEETKKEPKPSTSHEFPRTYKMRSKSNSGDRAPRLVRQSSSNSGYVDLEWPVWCPRKLHLSLPRVKVGKPARYKLEQPGSKRRRTSSESGSEDSVYTELNNPFGVGDVIIARRTPAQGKPYWPGKVLSTTGITVCIMFYGTTERLQISKCNVEWFYDGCKAHTIYDPKHDGQVWKVALEQAEADVKSSIGEGSVVWATFDGEWWPAQILETHQHSKFTVLWLDDDSTQVLQLRNLAPFLLAYSVYYSETLAEDYDNYPGVVERAYQAALLVLLDTKTMLEQESME